MSQRLVASIVLCSRSLLGQIELGLKTPGPELRARIQAFIDG
jgi:hypothetical protein